MRLYRKPLGSKYPAFILSPCQRSGTNYLFDLLTLNPNFELPLPVCEDHSVQFSDLLVDYVHKMARSWDYRWPGKGGMDKNIENYKKQLLHSLGDGVLSFFYKLIADGKRLVVKTPSTHNIDNFLSLFPQAKLLIIVRDGRDTVESGIRLGYPYHSYQEWMKAWSQGARKILNFMCNEAQLKDQSWKLLRYEELFSCTEVILKEVFDFLGIYDFIIDSCLKETIKTLPLRGSSFHRAGEERVHWKSVDKPEDFNPIGRWKKWNSWRKWQFKWLAGKELIELGYVPDNHW